MRLFTSSWQYLVVLTLLGHHIVKAQTQSPPVASYDSQNNVLQFDWQSNTNRTFFPQLSTDLARWNYAGALHFGIGAHTGMIQSNAPQTFLRLSYSDLPVATEAEAGAADFDLDGLSNLEELEQTHTDPQDPDSDHDGLPDGWEVAHSISPLDDGSIDPANGPDGEFPDTVAVVPMSLAQFSGGSTFTNRNAFIDGIKAHPAATRADKDGDGIPNERDAGPLSRAIDWETDGSLPKLIFAPLVGYNPSAHGPVLACNGRGDVIATKALYSGGVWHPLGQLLTGTPNYLPSKIRVNGHNHDAYVISQPQPTSVADDGRIVGSGTVYLDIVEEEVGPDEWEQHTASPTRMAFIWDSWATTPRLLNHPAGGLIQGNGWEEQAQIAPDGSYVIQQRAVPINRSNTNTVLVRVGANGGVSSTQAYQSVNWTTIGSQGFQAFNIGRSNAFAWFPTASSPVSLFADSRFSTPNPRSFFDPYVEPTYMGVKPGPPGGYCLNFWGKTMIRHENKWQEAVELAGFTLITSNGLAFDARIPNAIQVWKGGQKHSLAASVVNHNFSTSYIYPSNATATGNVLINAYGAGMPISTGFLVQVEIDWKAIDGFDNVDDHIDPWDKPIYGKRIFPDFKNPDDTEIRHKLEVIVKTSPILIGRTIFVKAFDVDDSTSENFDLDENGTLSVIDTNGKTGNDNLIDYLNTPQNGQFWTGSAWGGQTAQGTVDANGETKFIFRVGMQPGSNYRVIASVIDESMYAGVQTSNPAAAKYLGPETNQNGGTVASSLLTVWRRLWVENDSMKSPGLHSDGYLKNDLTSDVSNPTVKNSLIANGDTIVQFNPVISDQSSLRNLENGSLILPPGGVHQPIGSFAFNGTPFDGVTIAGVHPAIQAGQPFRLYDDDDFGLNRAPLPRNDLIDGTFKNVYKPAFIEVVDAANFKGHDYNPSKTVDFYRNHAVMIGPWFPINLQTPGVWDDAINLIDSKPLWIGNLIAGYQGEVGDDGDPNPSSEGHMEGITPGSRRYSIVYVENVRDYIDSIIRNSSTDNTAINSEIVRNIKLTAAHEIGHMPGGGDETSHHAENMLMGEDGYSSDNGLKFSPKSILRFRKTNQWQQP